MQAGKGACEKGVCTQRVTSADMTVEFQHIGIQCVTKKEVENSLNERKENKVDPFQQGFYHTKSTIDLNEVRICFQAFLQDSVTGKITNMLTPVCSNPIYNTHAKHELQILDPTTQARPRAARRSSYSAPGCLEMTSWSVSSSRKKVGNGKRLVSLSRSMCTSSTPYPSPHRRLKR